MLPRALAATLALALAPSAWADCGGASLLDDLSPEEEALLDAAGSQTHAEGLVWRATRGGETVLVVGTVHIDDDRLDALQAEIRPLVSEAESVLLEATEEERARIAALAAERPGEVFILEGPTLIDRLAPEDWEVVSEAAEAVGIPPFMASQFRPFYLSMALALPPCAFDGAMAMPNGLDLRIEEEALAAGLPVAALEPFDTVLDLLADQPEEDALAGLVAVARSGELMEASTVALLDLYFERRTAAAIALNEVSVGRMPDLDEAVRDEAIAWFDELLLGRRNRDWIPVIEEAAAEGPVLIAAGAGHLPGEEGVLALLEGRGWTVERLDG